MDRQSRGSQRLRRGFTLIEVLVVVAIIALLIAILVPSLRAARRQAKTVQCGVYLRTLGHAMIYYLEANKDTYPDSGMAFELLHKYVQKVGTRNATATRADVDIEWYLCPGDEIPHITDQITRPGPGGQPQTLSYETSFGVNTGLIYAVRPATNVPGVLRKSASVRHTSQIVSACDSGDDDFDGSGPWYLSEQNHKGNQFGHELHHETGNNFLYVDGHIQYHKALLKSPPQYGLPPYPAAWKPDWDGVTDRDYIREAPIP